MASADLMQSADSTVSLIGQPACQLGSVLHLVSVNSAVAGLEIAVCIAFTFIPTLLLKSGFSETQMSIVLGIAPFIALLTVPSMGRMSDNCRSKYGRRRPFILALSVILVFALILLYFGQTISAEYRVLKVVILAVGVILLDYSSQAALNPCEALVSDMAGHTGGGELGFTVYSGMLSFGSCLGYLLIALDWHKIGISIGNREQTAFMLCLLLYSISCAITMISAKEVPLKPRTNSEFVPLVGEVGSDPGYASDDNEPGSQLELGSPLLPTKAKNRNRQPELRVPLLRRVTPLTAALSIRRAICRPWNIITAGLTILKNVLYLPLAYYRTVYNAPVVLRNLYLADLLSWIAVMAHNLFYTDFVAVVVYGGKPDAPLGSVYDLLFDEGVRMGSWGLLLHSITAIVYAVFVQEHMIRWLGLKGAYKLGLAVHSASMAATVLFSSSLTCINLAAAASGVGYAVVTTIPNSLVTMYNEEAVTYYGTNTWGGVGEAIAILDSGYYLSQICLSVVMGHLVELTGLPHYYVIVACVAGVAAILISDKVVFTKKDLE